MKKIFHLPFFRSIYIFLYGPETNIQRGDNMKILPLGDRVLVKAKATEEKTASGIFIPQTAQEKTQIATVVAVGDDETIKVKAGQEIIHDKYAGTQIKDNGEDYLILSYSDILAVVE